MPLLCNALRWKIHEHVFTTTRKSLGWQSCAKNRQMCQLTCHQFLHTWSEACHQNILAVVWLFRTALTHLQNCFAMFCVCFSRYESLAWLWNGCSNSTVMHLLFLGSSRLWQPHYFVVVLLLVTLHCWSFDLGSNVICVAHNFFFFLYLNLTSIRDISGFILL